VVPSQRGGEFVVEAELTEELGMCLRSVETAILSRHHGGDHFVLLSCQRQLRPEEHAESGHGVQHRLGDEALGGADRIAAAVGAPYRLNLSAILEWEEGVHGFVTAPKNIVGFLHGHSPNPGHGSLPAALAWPMMIVTLFRSE
jgi:hypothetical protein